MIGLEPWSRNLILYHAQSFRNQFLLLGNLEVQPVLGYANLMTMQPAGVLLTWMEFCTAFRAHYIPEGVMAMKLDEFLALKQGDQTVMQYMLRFNHLSQYASEHINTNAKKKRWFMRGLNTKLQTMMTACTNITYQRQ